MASEKVVTIGATTVPAIGMGSWRLGQGRYSEQQEIAALRAGLSQGLRVIDTAEMYGDGASEALIGRALTGIRSQAYVVSKIYPWNASPERAQQSLEDSLRRLNIEALDLYLLHWYSGNDLHTVVALLEAMKKAGKIRAWGVSNFDLATMQQLWQVEGGDQCQVNQVFYNLAGRGIEYDLQPWCLQHHVAMMAYCPLGGAGSHLLQLPAVKTLADKYQVSPATILLAWAIRDGNMIAIPESGNSAHIDDNRRALDLTLTFEDRALLADFYPAPLAAEPLEIR